MQHEAILRYNLVKILLDECIDRRLAKDFVGYEVKTVPQMGWATNKNGELLALAEKEFDSLTTWRWPMRQVRNGARRMLL